MPGCGGPRLAVLLFLLFKPFSLTAATTGSPFLLLLSSPILSYPSVHPLSEVAYLQQIQSSKPDQPYHNASWSFVSAPIRLRCHPSPGNHRGHVGLPFIDCAFPSLAIESPAWILPRTKANFFSPWPYAVTSARSSLRSSCLLSVSSLNEDVVLIFWSTSVWQFWVTFRALSMLCMLPPLCSTMFLVKQLTAHVQLHYPQILGYLTPCLV